MLNKVSNVGGIIMELSKDFESLNHSLLLAKLDAFCLDNNAVSFMRSYLINRLKRCKINLSFSEWVKISTGLSSGSIVTPLLLNIFINYFLLLLQKCDLVNYVDGSTMYTSDKRFYRCRFPEPWVYYFVKQTKKFGLDSIVYALEKCSRTNDKFSLISYL